MKKRTSGPAEALKKELRSKVVWPRTYRIVVEGRLDTSWSEMLAGMQIKPRTGNRPTEGSVLTGSIRDEAELSGVLNTLYDLQFSLLSVEVTKCDAEFEKHP